MPLTKTSASPPAQEGLRREPDLLVHALRRRSEGRLERLHACASGGLEARTPNGARRPSHGLQHLVDAAAPALQREDRRVAEALVPQDVPPVLQDQLAGLDLDGGRDVVQLRDEAEHLVGLVEVALDESRGLAGDRDGVSGVGDDAQRAEARADPVGVDRGADGVAHVGDRAGDPPHHRDDAGPARGEVARQPRQRVLPPQVAREEALGEVGRVRPLAHPDVGVQRVQSLVVAVGVLVGVVDPVA